jgi:hypothetical protein
MFIILCYYAIAFNSTIKEPLMKHRLFTIITVVALLAFGLVGTSLAAGPDPETPATASQGTLEIVTLDHEITISYMGTGYNIHRYSTLRLAVTPGQNDFDYFCGSTKYFVGGVAVEAGSTTTVTLQPGECDEPVVSDPQVIDPLAQAYADGYADGFNCNALNYWYSSDPDIFNAYANGYFDGYGASPLCGLCGGKITTLDINRNVACNL